MILIIGLGNPGSKYDGTRHNVGFMMLDRMADDMGADFTFEKKLSADLIRDNWHGHDVALLKPQTYMNESGKAVKAFLDFYKLSPDMVVVVHDELDVPFGTCKIKRSQGSGGNNGVQSIIDSGLLKGEELLHVKMGVANRALDRARATSSIEAKKKAVSNFVLSKFSFTERLKLKSFIDKACVGLRVQLDASISQRN